MSASAHTPGPWRLVVDKRSQGICNGGGKSKSFRIGARDGEIIISARGLARPTKADGIANAHLIASAPDLLTALCELLDQIETLEGVTFTRDVEPYKAEACWDDAVRRAQDALAKARGAA